MFPEKSKSFTAHTTEPLIGAEPVSRLRARFITPNQAFFVRNHGPIPELDAQTYRLEITGLVRHPLTLTLEDLRARFPRRTVTATLQCAGNRRDELLAVAPIPNETPWGANAISTAQWSGYPLRELLQAADLLPTAQHIAFIGHDPVTRLGTTFGFGGSIALDKALTPDVILVDEMNGEPIPPVHGYPLRVVVPGFIGARSVKWLARIHVQTTPSDNYFQARAYRLFSPYVNAETVDWNSGLMLSENAITSVICEPGPGAVLPPGPVTVKGYALAGGTRHVARVDVSGDGGHTWTSARLQEAERWTWQFWETDLILPPGPGEIVVRALDSVGHLQPEHVAHVWNFKGYMNNAWHRVQVQIKKG